MIWYKFCRWAVVACLVLSFILGEITPINLIWLGIKITLWLSWPYVIFQVFSRFRGDVDFVISDVQPCDDMVGLIVAGWITNGVLKRFDLIQYEDELVISPVVFKHFADGRRTYFVIPVPISPRKGYRVLMRDSISTGDLIWRNFEDFEVDKAVIRSQKHYSSTDARLVGIAKVISELRSKFKRLPGMRHINRGYRKLKIVLKYWWYRYTLPGWISRRSYHLWRIANPAWETQSHAYFAWRLRYIWKVLAVACAACIVTGVIQFVARDGFSVFWKLFEVI